MKALGIDVGGSKIKAVVLDRKVTASTVVPTPQNKKDFLKAIEKIVRDFPCERIGMGLPGGIDFKKGNIISLKNLPFLSGFAMGEFLKKHAKLVRLDNDTKCVLRAEAMLGAARGYKDVFLFSIGTGIGGAALINGKIYYGRGRAGEIGHAYLDKGKTLEQLAGSKAFKKFDKKYFETIGHYLGLAAANVSKIFDPEAIIVCGGAVEQNGKHFLPIARRVAAENSNRKPPILKGELGELAGALGAALTVKI